MLRVYGMCAAWVTGNCAVPRNAGFVGTIIRRCNVLRDYNVSTDWVTQVVGK
jgi:hypothetical protein